LFQVNYKPVGCQVKPNEIQGPIQMLFRWMMSRWAKGIPLPYKFMINSPYSPHTTHDNPRSDQRKCASPPVSLFSRPPLPSFMAPPSTRLLTSFFVTVGKVQFQATCATPKKPRRAARIRDILRHAVPMVVGACGL
jgi:hypothetical protein